MPADRTTIETGRLLLRRHRPDDFEDYAALWADPEVTRFIGGEPFTREQAWIRFLRNFGMWDVLGFGFFVVTDPASGRYLGEAGFHDLQRGLEPSLDGTLEMGWALWPGNQGRGLATEAASAVIAWAEANHPGRAITCIIDPENAASLRVAGRLGFREFARAPYHGTPIILFERRVP